MSSNAVTAAPSDHFLVSRKSPGHRTNSINQRLLKKYGFISSTFCFTAQSVVQCKTDFTGTLMQTVVAKSFNQRLLK